MPYCIASEVYIETTVSSELLVLLPHMKLNAYYIKHQ